MQPIQPEQWVEALEQNRLLPWRVTNDIFTGQGIQIANNADTLHGVGKVVRIWDYNISDYITTPDTRRLNGHNQGAAGFNADGRDGWGASYYGVFQDVRFTSRTYTLGRRRSAAWRLWDVETYDGAIGDFGTEEWSSISTVGQSLIKTAAMMQKALNLWKQMVLGPDIDKYNLFAICNGHMSGRWVDKNPDSVFDGDGDWVAQPGPVTGQSIPPSFAPIMAMEWDDKNIPLMLQNIKITWNNLFIPQDNRIVLIDPYYEYRLLSALTGQGVPATEKAYSAIENGSFTRLMGWDFRFDIPTQYWPKVFLDDNYNVIHSEDGTASYDAVLSSIDGGTNPDIILQNKLTMMMRRNALNFIKTVFNPATGKFEKEITNYPLGQPSAVDYYGNKVSVAVWEDGIGPGAAVPSPGVGGKDPINLPDREYPWDPSRQGDNPLMGLSGQELYDDGVLYPNGPVLEGNDPNKAAGESIKRQVIGMFLYKPSAQISQEYSAVVNDVGSTRGPFNEMCTEVAFDAWVIDSLSHGIILLVDAVENTGTFAIPVQIVGGTSAGAPVGGGDDDAP